MLLMLPSQYADSNHTDGAGKGASVVDWVELRRCIKWRKVMQYDDCDVVVVICNAASVCLPSFCMLSHKPGALTIICLCMVCADRTEHERCAESHEHDGGPERRQ
jgi:hypothetical protein